MKYKTPAECLLKEAFQDISLSLSHTPHTFRWHKRFIEDQNEVEGNKHLAHSRRTKTNKI